MPESFFDRLMKEAILRERAPVLLYFWLVAQEHPGTRAELAARAREEAAKIKNELCALAVLRTAYENFVKGETDALETLRLARGLHEAEHQFVESCPGLQDDSEPPGGVAAFIGYIVGGP